MAKIFNVEKSKYISSNIEILAKNRLGEYSKFLERNPIYVTYYKINENLSTYNTGTGNIQTDLGSSSPVRYNRISEFPLYNISDLKPDIEYDDTGYDVNLELSDIVILPNTIKPRAGDFFLVTFPGIREFLFRVTDFKYNTIQSNDFYLITAELKRTEIEGLEDKFLSMLVVERYHTIFDNIGTTDRCFIKEDDVDYVNSIMDLFLNLRSYYKDAFFDKNVSSFIVHDNYNEHGDPQWYYDRYIDHFIKKSNIFYDKNSPRSLVTYPADIIPRNFEIVFRELLYSAVLEKKTVFMKPYSYIIPIPIEKAQSILKLMRYWAYNVVAVNSNVPLIFAIPLTPLEPSTPVDPEEPTEPDTPVDPEEPTDPDAPIDPEEPPVDPDDDIPLTPLEPSTPVNPEEPTDPEEPPVDPDTPVDPEEPPVDPDDDIPLIPLEPAEPPESIFYPIHNIIPQGIEYDTFIPINPLNPLEYFPSEFLLQIKNGIITIEDYYQLIIYNYLAGENTELDTSKLYSLLSTSIYNYKYLPMIIFIVRQIYNSYFNTENEFMS